MFGPGSDRWHWRTSLDEEVSFCVWILPEDGMHVAPFTLHAAGHGELQHAGLTPAGWQTWLRNVVAAEAVLREALESSHETFPKAVASHIHQDPSAFWEGPSAVAALLTEMWNKHRPQWDRWTSNQADYDVQIRLSLAQAALWDALAPVRARLPTLHVFLTEYPYDISYLVPPVTVILGLEGGVFDGERFRAAVLQSAFALAAL